MKAEALKKVVDDTISRFPPEKLTGIKAQVIGRKPVELVSSDRMALREIRLTEAEIRPSPAALERILGENDLVDVNYLVRALFTAKSICRIILRDRFGREIGYGTGFKISPRLMLTNQHVLESAARAETALAEFDYELDQDNRPKSTTRYPLDPLSFFINDEGLDFALAAINPTPFIGKNHLDDYGFIRMIREIGKINPGECVNIIQHPSGQPKQIALRENKLLSIEEQVIWYQSDTAQGSSGSLVLNDSWQLVGLHHSGVPRTDAQGNWLLKNGSPAGADAEDGDIDWVANEGIRASRIVYFVEENAETGSYLDEFRKICDGQSLPPGSPESGELTPAFSHASNQDIRIDSIQGGAKITIPLTVTVSFSELSQLTSGSIPASVQPASAVERIKKPIVDPDYTARTGYDPDFLGVHVPLPEVRKSRTAQSDDGGYVLKYEHFSIAMAKNRRLAFFTASNVDANPEKKEPEPGKDYSRAGLGGFTSKDTEMWLTDPRIPENTQLPDLFFTKDGGAFDKGHLVRREDVCWGDTYEQVQRANGDTYHTTNCSPQVADFNRSSQGGVWGKLENLILKQAKTEKYCVFSGPLLTRKDRVFIGKDQRGELRFQVPQAYWKIIIAHTENSLQAFAFLLKQDLGNVPLEFAVDAQWKNYMLPIGKLDRMLVNLHLPEIIKQADQYDRPASEILKKNPELFGLE